MDKNLADMTPEERGRWLLSQMGCDTDGLMLVPSYLDGLAALRDADREAAQLADCPTCGEWSAGDERKCPDCGSSGSVPGQVPKWRRALLLAAAVVERNGLDRTWKGRGVADFLRTFEPEGMDDE